MPVPSVITDLSAVAASNGPNGATEAPSVLDDYQRALSGILRTLYDSILAGTVVQQSADIVSAATLNLDSATGNVVDVTGSTGITAVTLTQGRWRLVRFTGAPTITNGASLVLPGAVNYAVTAGDYAVFVGYAAGVVRVAFSNTRFGAISATTGAFSSTLSVTGASTLAALTTAGVISSAGIVQVTAETGLPAATTGGLASGYSGSSNSRLYIGDGSGYKLNFSRRVGSVTTDWTSVDDTGHWVFAAPAAGVTWTLNTSTAGTAIVINNNRGVISDQGTASGPAWRMTATSTYNAYFGLYEAGQTNGWWLSKTNGATGGFSLGYGSSEGAGSTVLAVTSTGAVTMPSQISFRATASAQQNAASNTEATTYGATAYNVGSYFNATTGRFTPGVAGKYLVTAYGACNTTSSSSHQGITICKNGIGTVLSSSDSFVAGTDSTTRSVTALIDLNGSTDYVSMFISNSVATSSNVISVFSAQLLS